MSYIVSAIGAWALQREWSELQTQLRAAYESSIAAPGQPPRLAQELLISGEDHRFFAHRGIDGIAILRCLWRRAVSGRREGASTIEMQIVRVLTNRFERTLRRKIREMALATLVADVVPKEALPQIYLAIGYYGWRMNGFEAACRRLGLQSGNLTVREAAGIVARLKYPEPRQQSTHRRAQIARRVAHLAALHVSHRQRGIYVGLVTRTSYEAI
jgi:membrane peptidoglycan carboxypeptidase